MEPIRPGQRSPLPRDAEHRGGLGDLLGQAVEDERDPLGLVWPHGQHLGDFDQVGDDPADRLDRFYLCRAHCA